MGLPNCLQWHRSHCRQCITSCQSPPVWQLVQVTKRLHPVSSQPSQCHFSPNLNLTAKRYPFPKCQGPHLCAANFLLKNWNHIPPGFRLRKLSWMFCLQPTHFRGVFQTSVWNNDSHVLRSELQTLLAKEAKEIVPLANSE